MERKVTEAVPMRMFGPMKYRILFLALLVLPTVLVAGELAERFRADANALRAATAADTTLWPLLAEFCDACPRRLSGSENLVKGLEWLEARMRRDGWNVRSQPAMVPHWVRGEESLQMIAPLTRPMPVAGLCGSIGTDGKPLRAEVLVVGSFDELKDRAAEVKGRIVVYNVPFTTYGETVRYRYGGAVEAARYGAVASLVRSVGPYGIQTVHTGGMAYNDSVKKIPSAAITMEDAMLLQRMQGRGQRVVLELVMNAQTLPDAPSRNLIIEIPGTELPNEVVVMGGHIDSWDLGTGAMDDAGGCFASWRALEHIKKLGLKPKRTIRVVFWTNEENGLRGGTTYADSTTHEKHVMGIESDGGTFQPVGFSTSATGELRAKIEDVAQLLSVVNATKIETGEGGADTSPLHARGVPVMELVVDTTKYFWYHHTEGDTPDKIVPRDLNDCTYAMAVMAWVCGNW